MTAKQAPEGVGGPTPVSPLPWHVFASRFAAEHRNAVEINDADGLTLAWAQKFVPPYTQQSEANARYIVHACNCFSELLEALEGICAEAEHMSMTMRRRAIFNAGKAALRKARGQ